MKIIFEDENLEEFVMSGESCIAVPIDIYRKVGAETEMTVYSCYAKEGEAFAQKFGDDPFSEDAADYIKSVFSPLMKDAGYEFDSRGDYLIYKFTADKSYEPRDVDCPYRVVMISTNEEFEKYYNNTTRDVELDDDDPFDVCFAAVDGDMIVSFAAVNDISDDDSYEINVESSPAVRGKSCATAVVVSLCSYITALGEKVSYKCRSRNAPSRKVAQKAGLFFDGIGYSFVCYATEEIDDEIDGETEELMIPE